MSYDTQHLRDDAILLADAFEEIDLIQRVNQELYGCAMNRVIELMNTLMYIHDQGGALSPAAYRELLAAIEEAKEAADMKKY